MNLLIAFLSFLAGAVTMGALAYRAFSRIDGARKADPLECPPNKHVAELRDAVRRQLADWQRYDYRLDAQSPGSVREVLKSLDSWSVHSAIWTVKDGWLTLPDGRLVPIRQVAQQLDKALMESYRALDEAAAVVLDYANLLPLGTLEEKGQLLYSRKFAFEPQIVELARLLDLNSDGNDVARFGGAELWRKQSARHFPHLHGVHSVCAAHN